MKIVLLPLTIVIVNTLPVAEKTMEKKMVVLLKDR
jgi:hypothetical protein